MKYDPLLHEPVKADIPAIASQMLANAEFDLASGFSDILHTLDELDNVGINPENDETYFTRADFLKMLEIVLRRPDRAFHPDAIIQ